MSRSWPSTLALVPLLAWAAPAGGQVDVRDSAGVRIVTSSGPARPVGWRVEPRPFWSVRPAAEVAGARRLPEGRVAVLTPLWLRVYDARGRPATLHAGGEGPAALRTPVWLGSGAGDTLLVFDQNGGRLLVVGSRGLARSVALPELGESFAHPVGVFADGSLVARPGADLLRLSRAPEGTFREAEPYLRFSRRGAALGAVGRFPAEELFVRKQGSRTVWEALPFGRRTVATVAGDRLYAGHNGAFEIGVYSPEGRLVRLIRRRYTPAPVTPEDVRRHGEGLLGPAATPERRAQVGEMLARAPIPRTLPAFVRLLVDATGSLWAEEHRRDPAAGGQWTVFAPDGRMLGTVSTPPGLEVTQVGADFVLGVGAAAGGAQEVRVYRLHRGR